MKGNIVQNPLGKRFEIFVQILIVISIIAFAVETLPDISSTLRDSLEWLERICIFVFVVEYLLRFGPARDTAILLVDINRLAIGASVTTSATVPNPEVGPIQCRRASLSCGPIACKRRDCTLCGFDRNNTILVCGWDLSLRA